MHVRNHTGQLLTVAAAGPLHDPRGQLQQVAWELSAALKQA